MLSCPSQIRHLPAFGDSSGMPMGEYWPATTTWQYQTHANGGYWGTASGWVLPVIGMNNSAVARQLVRDAIADARRNGGLSEWVNPSFCCNCEGARPADHTAPWSLQRALLTPTLNPGSLYRRGKST